jgi:hypothetical protein
LNEQAEALFALSKSFFCGPAVGAVAHDLGEADDVAVLVVEPHEQARAPKPATVLPYLPTLVFGPSLAGSDFQFSCIFASGAVLRSEENRSRFSKHVGFAETRQALRTLVPARDAIVW